MEKKGDEVTLESGTLWWYYSDSTKGDIGATTTVNIHVIDAETNSEMWERDMPLNKPSFLQMLGLQKQSYLLNTYNQTIDIGFNRSYHVWFGLTFKYTTTKITNITSMKVEYSGKALVNGNWIDVTPHIPQNSNTHTEVIYNTAATWQKFKPNNDITDLSMNGETEYFENIQSLSGTSILIKPLSGEYLDGSQWDIKVTITGVDEVGNEVVGTVTATVIIDANFVTGSINVDLTDINVKMIDKMKRVFQK